MTSSHPLFPKDSRLDTESTLDGERRSSAGRRLHDKLVEHALTQVSVGMAMVGSEGQLIDANLVLCAMFGYPPAELSRIDFKLLTYPADRERLAHLIAAVSIAGSPDASAEIRYIGRDGMLFWGRTNLARFTPGAEQDGLLLIIENIDRLKLAEERLELAMDAADLGVFEWNLESGAVVLQHLRTRHILNALDGAPAGLLSEIIQAEDVESFAAALQTALNHPERHFHHICRVRARNAAPLKWIEIVGQVRGESAASGLESNRVVGILTDITARKTAEQALQEAEVRKNNFLTMLAHELRNPLAPIKAASLLVQRLTPEHEAKVHSAAQMIERQSAHLSILVEQLLEVTRISTGHIDLSRAVVDLSILLTEVVESMALLVDNRRQTLALSLPSEPLWVDLDAVRMTQVVSNLIDNASRYTADGGHITLTALAGDSHCEVCVADNGQGVPPELLPHIFDPFIQGKVSAARTNAGLGIGLSIVQQLVNLHGGSVRGESAGAGHGSQFVVTLPLAAAPLELPLANVPPSTLPHSDNGAGILIVDDNADAAESLAELLTLSGYTVRTAGNAAHAFQVLSQWQPAVIVLDIGLPDLDGFDITLQLRAAPQTRETLIIALSGYGSAEYLARARVVGIDIYLTKPAPLDRLISAIQDRLRAT